jgi:hypothetical protein
MIDLELAFDLELYKLLVAPVAQEQGLAAVVGEHEGVMKDLFISIVR